MDCVADSNLHALRGFARKTSLERRRRRRISERFECLDYCNAYCRMRVVERTFERLSCTQGSSAPELQSRADPYPKVTRMCELLQSDCRVAGLRHRALNDGHQHQHRAASEAPELPTTWKAHAKWAFRRSRRRHSAKRSITSFSIAVSSPSRYPTCAYRTTPLRSTRNVEGIVSGLYRRAMDLSSSHAIVNLAP